MPCLDIETNTYGRSDGEISDRCIEFLNQFKSLSGVDCMIYTGGYFGRDNLDSRVKQYKGWIAHYGVDTPMETGFEVVGHQFTENGSVSGVNGNCDVNNFTEGILINLTEKKKSTSIVVYANHVDKRAAEYLSDYLQCPCMDNNIPYDYSTIDNVYCVGAGEFTSYMKENIGQGKDRWEVIKDVLKFCGKL